MPNQIVLHARKELALLDADPLLKNAIFKAVKAFSVYDEHSGASAAASIHILTDLLSFKNITPLTDNPDEWMMVDTGKIWQSTRRADAFSNNGGKTYYLLSEGANDKNRNPLHRSKKVSNGGDHSS